ncbi:penicillin acylase family protein [Chloroflexales bacterium ZM16-3]|nr:penicillin acylase family protein [Chloroflexales bacterium ZM16-3]
MINLTRLGRTVGIAAGVVAGLTGVGLAAAVRRPLPRTSGKLALSGLAARAEVRRDRWGVPHIYAESNADLFAALGYVHAQDRLWQMELNRRSGHGRLAEVFGPVALSSDTFIRTLGFSRVARREVDLLDEHTRGILTAYVRGVNAFVAANSRRLPLEFGILGLTPQPWELADILIWPKMMSLSLSANWTSELLNARIVAALGAERAASIAPRYPDDAPMAVPPGVAYDPAIGEAALRMLAAAAPFTGEPGGPQGSNAWVVGGSRSVSGRPLLADDPHLGLALPGVWYLAHLEGGDYHATGGTFPGTCGVIIGHNRRVAWGVTNGMTDNQDLYIERFDPADPLRYQWRGEWLRAETAREEIIVKGQAAPSVVEVRVTRHGPVIDQIAGPEAGPLSRPVDVAESYSEALALRWTALDPAPGITRAVLGLNRAGSWAEFRAALADWDVPPQNFVYADVDGNIGYALAGRLPVRAGGDGQLPVPGWDGAHEWRGFIPPEAMPVAYNPPGGMAVTANNWVAGADYPFHNVIKGEWLNHYRAERIAELIVAEERHDPRSFARIHYDVRSLPGLVLARLVADLPVDEPTERKARDILAAWDGELGPDSAAGAIYDSLRHHLLRIAYAELGGLIESAAGLGAFASIPANNYLERALPGLLERIAAAPAPGRPDPWLGPGRTWDDLLLTALARAVAELRRLGGGDPARWSYGQVHRLTLRHPLGGVAALSRLFNRGPWPAGGDIDTVNQAYTPRNSPAGPVFNAPSYRQIIDVGGWDASRVILPAGQSGHPASKHYSDMADAWRGGGYCPMLWTRAAVERDTAEVLILEPV